MNNTSSEIKNTLERINNRITDAEEWVSELEDSIVKISVVEQKGKKE